MTDLEMEGVAPAALPEEAPEAVAWEDPDLPRRRAFFRTLRQLLLTPGDFFASLARLPDDSSPAEPLAFGLIAGTVGTLGSAFWYFLLWAAADCAMAGGTGTPQIYRAAAVAALALAALAPLLAAVNLAICALSLWAGTSMVGSDRGFKAAWRTCCYAQGALVLGVVPFLGAPVAGILVTFLLYLGAQSLLTPASSLSALAAWLMTLFLEGCCWGLLTGGLLAFLGLLGFLLLLGGG